MHWRDKVAASMFAVLTLAVAVAADVSSFVAAENGIAQADIVLPVQANMAERFAADELRHHLEKATGAKFPVVRDGASSETEFTWHFHVGATDAAKSAGLCGGFKMDEFAVDVSGRCMYLRGGDRDGNTVGDAWSAACQGTLYAVYEFLERKMGVKWIWPGELGEVVPKRRNLQFAAFSLHGTVPLAMRTWRSKPGPSAFGWTGGVSTQKSFHEAQRKFLVRHRQGASRCFNVNHNFSDWWRRFGKTHPEYFAKLCNGKREPLKGDDAGEFSAMCVSNLGYHKRIVEDWRSSPERDPRHVPYRPYMNLCQNDSPGMCTCDHCRAWDAHDPRFATTPYWQGNDPLTRFGRFYRLSKVDWGEEGVGVGRFDPPSLSDRYVKFYNAVIAEARRYDSDVRAVGYAYANYRAAPTETKVDPALYLEYVPAGFYPYPEATRRQFRSEWLGWRKAGVKDFIYRPNYMLSGANFPVNFGRGIAEDFAFAYTNGMFACYFDSLIGSWGASAPMYYVLTRAIHEPLVGYEKAMEEFCSAFGAASREVRAYVDFIERHTKSVDARVYGTICRANKTIQGSQGGGNGSFCLVAADVFAETWFDSADSLLDRAAYIAMGDAAVSARVAFLRKGLKDARLTRRVRVAQKSGDKPAFDAALADLGRHRASVEKDGVADYGYIASSERYCAGWWNK